MNSVLQVAYYDTAERHRELTFIEDDERGPRRCKEIKIPGIFKRCFLHFSINISRAEKLN